MGQPPLLAALLCPLVEGDRTQDQGQRPPVVDWICSPRNRGSPRMTPNSGTR